MNRIKNYLILRKQKSLKYFLTIILIIILFFIKLTNLSNFAKNEHQNNSSENEHKNSFSLKTYSESGEDVILSFIFDKLKIDKLFYVDIGAHDPLIISNTALFHEKGGRGINVEANPDLIANFKKKRPNDINLNFGIGSKEGTFSFYIINPEILGLGTFNEQKVKETLNISDIKEADKFIEVKKIPVKTLKQLFDEYVNQKIDLLSIDIEEEDYNVLKSFDFSKNLNKPKVIIVEGNNKIIRKNLEVLISKYGYFKYTQINEINLIFISNEFKDIF